MQKSTLTSQDMAHSITKGYIFATREDEQPGPPIDEVMRPVFEGKLTLYRLATALIVLMAEEEKMPALLDVRDKIERAFFMSEEGEDLLLQVKIAMQNLNDMIFSEVRQELSWAKSWFEEVGISETDPITLCLFAADRMQQYVMVTKTIRENVITG